MTKKSIVEVVAAFYKQYFGSDLPEDAENLLLAFKMVSLAAAKGDANPDLLAWAAKQVLPAAIEQYESGDNPLLEEYIRLRDSGLEREEAFREIRARRDRVWGLYYDHLIRLCADRLER
jgi:hypothetical protein